jgi:hypothetical protein
VAEAAGFGSGVLVFWGLCTTIAGTEGDDPDDDRDEMLSELVITIAGVINGDGVSLLSALCSEGLTISLA